MSTIFANLVDNQELYIFYCKLLFRLRVMYFPVTFLCIFIFSVYKAFVNYFMQPLSESEKCRLFVDVTVIFVCTYKFNIRFTSYLSEYTSTQSVSTGLNTAILL